MYWSEVPKYLNWDTAVELLTPKAVFRLLDPTPVTIVSILRGSPRFGSDDLATRDYLVALLCLGNVEVKHLREAYDSAKLALDVLLEDLPKAAQFTAADPKSCQIIGRIPGSTVENGLNDAQQILQTLAIRPFQALIAALNKHDISIFKNAMDEAWKFQEGHTLLAAPFTNDTPAPTTPADVFYPEARRLREQGKCPACELDVGERAFTDTLSVAEFQISGLCQRCQNAVFE